MEVILHPHHVLVKLLFHFIHTKHTSPTVTIKHCSTMSSEVLCKLVYLFTS